MPRQQQVEGHGPAVPANGAAGGALEREKGGGRLGHAAGGARRQWRQWRQWRRQLVPYSGGHTGSRVLSVHPCTHGICCTLLLA